MANTTTLAAVEFHGATLVTTLVDGVPHVALKPVCTAIGIDWEAQYKRINRDPVLSSTISMMEIVADDGKRRDMVALPLKHLNGWLFGVDANRVAPEVRDRLIDYQRECYDVLANYWQKGSATNPRGAAALVGQHTGMPTSQLIALQDHSWKLVQRLKVETVRELREAMYRQLKAVFQDLGQEAPPLEAIGHTAPDASAVAREFWAAFDLLVSLGHPVNHSRNAQLVAVNLKQVCELAEAEHLQLAPLGVLKKHLRACRSPRFVDVKTVNSQHAGVTIHAWVFQAQEGGAA